MSAPEGRPRLYPLRFAPLFEYRLWGGRRLAEFFAAPLPVDGPVGEAWLLSDRDEHPSRVADGPLEGRTIGELLREFGVELLGERQQEVRRLPLLLKILDAEQMLSVQVHPSDANLALLPRGETGKTEAWVVLHAEKDARIAGLAPGTTPAGLRDALAARKVAATLSAFSPKEGDAVFLPAGTVHCLGDGVLVFEIQQNSDVTFRLYDWDRIDTKTGQPRALQEEAALACIDFAAKPVRPSMPLEESTPLGRERLFHCGQFSLWRVRTTEAFSVGVAGAARILVCVEGSGHVEHGRNRYPVRRGDTFILAAALGECEFQPDPRVTLLEVALPEPPYVGARS